MVYKERFNSYGIILYCSYMVRKVELCGIMTKVNTNPHTVLFGEVLILHMRMSVSFQSDVFLIICQLIFSTLKI